MKVAARSYRQHRGMFGRKTLNPKPYSRSPKVGNPIASILESNVYGISALFGLNPVSNFMGSTIVGVEASFHSTAQLKTQDRPVHPETKRARMRVAQRSQYPLIEEYTLNHNINT